MINVKGNYFNPDSITALVKSTDGVIVYHNGVVDLIKCDDPDAAIASIAQQAAAERASAATSTRAEESLLETLRLARECLLAVSSAATAIRKAAERR